MLFISSRRRHIREMYSSNSGPGIGFEPRTFGWVDFNSRHHQFFSAVKSRGGVSAEKGEKAKKTAQNTTEKFGTAILRVADSSRRLNRWIIYSSSLRLRAFGRCQVGDGTRWSLASWMRSMKRRILAGTRD